MMKFQPDYTHIENAARNIVANRTPLYEHIVSTEMMERVLNNPFGELYRGDGADRAEFFRQYTRFFYEMGYDTVSFECCIGGALPGGGALGGHKQGVIQNRADYEKYPWDGVVDTYFQLYSDDFRLLRDAMPVGMKGIGGPGNGVFECVQELVGYTGLCYMAYDDPQLYADMFRTIGGVMLRIWKRFLSEFGDIYTVCRFGDDLGFKSQTLLSAEDIINHVVPQYAAIVEEVHQAGKPFLLHSCGNIFDVMDAIIETAGIDAKHSNEDVIAPFSEWTGRYGDRIGNFGGIDMDILCRSTEQEIKDYVTAVYETTRNVGGVALGSGNSIPDYVPTEGYLAMVDTVRSLRGM